MFYEEFSQNSQEKTCTRVIFLNEVAGLQACNFIKKETVAQVFSCEFCEIFKNAFFTEHLWTTASVYSKVVKEQRVLVTGEESY